MPLTKRDKAIIDDLNRFRVMDRDSISVLHFKELKNPRFAANNVLLRLLREGHIQRSTAFQPYVYFGPEVNMKKNSAKIGHFLAILQVYIEMKNMEGVQTFLVEPKYGKKGMAEPDIFAIYRKTPFFIEVQRTIYSEKLMSEKLERYDDLFKSGILDQELWQPADRKLFPHVLILSDQRYAIDQYPFRVFQSTTFSEFTNSLRSKEVVRTQPVENKSGIRVVIGG